LQKAGASSGADALPPRDVTTEVIVARKTLTELLLEKAGGSLSAQDPHLAIVLDFTASLVADLVYKKRYSDKSVWRSCVGVYMAPWLPNGKDGATELAELVCKHFYAIERVSLFVVLVHNAHLAIVSG
jgi:elongation factor 3